MWRAQAASEAASSRLRKLGSDRGKFNGFVSRSYAGDLGESTDVSNQRTHQRQHRRSATHALRPSLWQGRQPRARQANGSRPLQYCVVLMTVPRPPGAPAFYLTVLDRVMRQRLLANVTSEVVIFDTLPGTSPELSKMPYRTDLEMVARLVRVVGSTSLSPPGSSSKMAEDWAGALRVCQQRGAQYCLVLKDDALPVPGLFPALQRLLPAPGAHWTCMRLHYPEKWLGYDLANVWELPALGALGGLLTLFATWMWEWGHRRANQSPAPKIKGEENGHHDGGNDGHGSMAVAQLAAVATLAFFLTMATAYAVGRPYVLQLIHALPFLSHRVISPGCCNRGVLFPASVVPDVALYLEAHAGETASDLLLDRYVQESNGTCYLSVPNLVKYIGLVRPSVPYLCSLRGLPCGSAPTAGARLVWRDPRMFKGIWV